jgi:hypothetical protein
MTRTALALALAALAACSGRGAERSREEAFGPGAKREPARAFDFAKPLEALAMTADDAAARLGSFAWDGEVSWSVARGAPAAAPPTATAERHRLRQLATGEFEVSADIDPGTGPNAEAGRQVIWANGMTYARSRWAPYRERPTDGGRDARRHRDESFRLAADLAALYGPALAARPSGEVTAAGRKARRYVLSLSGEAPKAAPPPPGLPQGAYDPDTQRRVAFLQGRVPVALEGELLLDAATGAPLAVRMAGAFSQAGDPQLRVEYQLAARVKAIGADVPGVHAPKGALADERKPKGVARALEAAGLRRRAGAEEAAPDEGDEEPAGDEAAGR